MKVSAPTVRLDASASSTAVHDIPAVASSSPSSSSSSGSCDLSEPSAVVSLPTRQLLAHTKVAVAAGSTVEVELQFKTSALAGALRQAWPGLLSCWVGHGMGLHPGTKRSYAGSVGEGAQPVFSNLTLVLPMVQEPSDCNPC